jgi:uncharacterized membrane protein HdeD (DUF308 family)
MQFEFTHDHIIPAVVGALALIGGIVLPVAALTRRLTDGPVFQPKVTIVNRSPKP